MTPKTPEERKEWAQEWCERHIELEYDDVMAGLVAALEVGAKENARLVEWLKETRDSGHKFAKENTNAYTLWGDLADEIDELLKGTR